VESCIAAVETAFSLLGSGEAAPPVTAGLHVSGGGFHIKAGILDLSRTYFAAKLNGNFPANRRLHGLPTIQGVVVLADATDGRVLAIADSVELTARRTAAATAVAARHLAGAAASTAAVVGCGVQASYQLEALRVVCPLAKVIAVDADRARAEHFARGMSERLQLDCVAGTLLDAAAAEPGIWITCTTSTDFFLFPEHVRNGAFVAGVGVDNEYKRELAPALLAQSHVIADLVEQCQKMGDLHHALAAGVAPKTINELGHIVAGKHSVRDNERDIVVFDSTGIGLQDVAACAAVYEAALEARERGEQVELVEFAL
jgi:ornithine cyclodeaminase/alanine dehydrogenase-like protein (mu-crystallin family)